LGPFKTYSSIPSIPNLKFRFFYSGLARRKSALSLLWLPLMSTAVVSFQWFFCGYSLAFSHTAGNFIGDLDGFLLLQVLAQPSVASPLIPDLLFCVFRGMSAAVS
jgi:Amt family ammonium transporter